MADLLRGLGAGLEGAAQGFEFGLGIADRLRVRKLRELEEQQKRAALLSSLFQAETEPELRSRIQSLKESGFPIPQEFEQQANDLVRQRLKSMKGLIDAAPPELQAPLTQALESGAIPYSGLTQHLDNLSRMITQQSATKQAQEQRQQMQKLNQAFGQLADELRQSSTLSPTSRGIVLKDLRERATAAGAQAGVELNQSIFDAIEKLPPNQQQTLIQFLEHVPAEHAVELLASKDTAKSIAMLEQIATTYEPAPPIEVRTPLDAKLRQNLSQQAYYKTLSVIDPNPSYIQILSKLQQEEIELQDQKTVQDIEWSARSSVRQDPLPDGSTGTPLSMRVGSMFRRLRQIESTLPALRETLTPASQARAAELEKEWADLHKRITELVPYDKLSTFDRQAMARLEGGFDPTNPEHVAYVMSTPALYQRMQALSHKLALLAKSDEDAMHQRILEQGSTDDVQRLSRELFNKTVRDLSPAQLKEVYQEWERRRVEQKQREWMSTQARVSLSPEQAGRFARAYEGMLSTKQVMNKLVLPNGQVDRKLLAEMTLWGTSGAPWTPGRQIATKIAQALWAQLRAESGAQVTENEVKNIWIQYGPRYTDDDKTVIMKLGDIYRVLAGSVISVDPTGFLRQAIREQLDPALRDTESPMRPSLKPEDKKKVEELLKRYRERQNPSPKKEPPNAGQ